MKATHGYISTAPVAHIHTSVYKPSCHVYIHTHMSSHKAIKLFEHTSTSSQWPFFIPKIPLERIWECIEQAGGLSSTQSSTTHSLTELQIPKVGKARSHLLTFRIPQGCQLNLFFPSNGMSFFGGENCSLISDFFRQKTRWQPHKDCVKESCGVEASPGGWGGGARKEPVLLLGPALEACKDSPWSWRPRSSWNILDIPCCLHSRYPSSLLIRAVILLIPVFPPHYLCYEWEACTGILVCFLGRKLFPYLFMSMIMASGP